MAIADKDDAGTSVPDPAEPLPIHYLDEHLVVTDKPSGLLVHRADNSPDRSALLQQLRDQIGQYVYPIHRIDRPASGLVAMGLSKPAAAGLQASLAAPDARKVYLALVRGEAPERGRTERPLSDERGQPQPASTRWRRLARGEGCSLLAVEIDTGRHHQIRRHMAHLRHQILGDTTHGKGRINQRFREAYGLPRLFLHAWRLSFRHPIDDRRLELEAPMPADLLDCLDRIPGIDPGSIPRPDRSGAR